MMASAAGSARWVPPKPCMRACGMMSDYMCALCVADDGKDVAFMDEGSEAAAPAEVIQNQPHDEAMSLEGSDTDESVPSPTATDTAGISPVKGLNPGPGPRNSPPPTLHQGSQWGAAGARGGDRRDDHIRLLGR